MQERIAWFCVRLALVLVGAGVLLLLPDPLTESVVGLKNAIVCFALVLALGVLLYDTFYAERHQR